jgi:hypothetical protein
MGKKQQLTIISAYQKTDDERIKRRLIDLLWEEIKSFTYRIIALSSKSADETDRQEMMQEAYLRLPGVAAKFDGSQGNGFLCFWVWSIRDSATSYRLKQNIINPRKKCGVYSYPKISSLNNKLFDDSSDEIVENLTAPGKEIEFNVMSWLMSMSRYFTKSEMNAASILWYCVQNDITINRYAAMKNLNRQAIDYTMKNFKRKAKIKLKKERC